MKYGFRGLFMATTLRFGGGSEECKYCDVVGGYEKD